jgi:hypothetical protein
MKRGSFTNADVDTLETLFEINTAGSEHLFVSFVVGAANLSAFTVDYRAHPSGGWATVANAGADFTSPAGVIEDASGNLTTAASGATVHWLKLKVGGVETVRLQAAGTSSTVTGHYALL